MGIVVPALLVEAGCPVEPGRRSTEASRSAAAAETIKWVTATWRRLPDVVLDAALPDPGTILKTWPVGARTRGALARLGTAGLAETWRVRDLLGVSRLGPVALVDLLAAREEKVRLDDLKAQAAVMRRPLLATPHAPLASRLDDIAALVHGRLPLRPEELGALVVDAGLSRAPLGLDDVMRLFRERRVPLPFRVVRRGGARVLVAPSALASAEALVTTASSFVFHWGLCPIVSVVDRLRSSAADELGASAAARVLATLPRFRWLDEASGWFSFVGTTTRASVAIRKVFSVVDRVSIRELTLAIGKRVSALATAPRAAVEKYLAEVAGCSIEGDWVRPRRPFAAKPLVASERTIVELLRAAGGRLKLEALRSAAVGAGVKLAAVRHFLRTSPLVLAGRRDVRLVGAFA
ncbi:MAG TPA: hypothetical protein VHJ20_13270 [Polyangia bacterium]|nr:hypothetical protein [Polyangia bacterium]